MNSPSSTHPSPFVSPNPRPAGPVVMTQSWERLLFLHWEWEPAEIQRTLPAGLAVDTWNGAAYVGVVPFFMRNVRPRFCPRVRWLSDFLELNVRTYVRDRHGRPGVWFYSLDCNQPVAVLLAQTIFRLPYFHARMRAQTGPESDFVYYDSRRSGWDPAYFEFRGVGFCETAFENSLEQFLVERYRLFAHRNGVLFSGEVWHEPYRITMAEVPRWSAEPLIAAGFAAGALAPDHALYSPGVDVSVYPLQRVD